MNIFDLSLRLNDFPIKKAKALLGEIQSKDENEFEDYLKAAKNNIVNFHIENNPFYKEFATSVDAQNWESIPVMRKQDLQIPLSNRLSKGFDKKSVYVNKTSGSSGDPFVFAKDKFCHAMTWAVIQDRFSWYNIGFSNSLQARFYGIPLDKKGYLKERLKDGLSKRFRFSIFDLSDKEFEKILKRFSKTRFQYINGYTSPIVQFAKYLKKKNIILKEVCPTLEYCIVTSEMLFEDDKLLMEEHFGVPVKNEYGASELDIIAFENPQGEMQITNETLFVEILDENGSVQPLGHEGRIVITSLYNKAHPFIRYDIGDVGVIDSCSIPTKTVLKKLIGRSDDIVKLPSGKTAAGLTFYYITKSVIDETGNVKEFIIEQEKFDTFRIKYSSNLELNERNKSLIKSKFAKFLEPGLTVHFDRVDALTRNESGKLKQFISHIN